MPEQKNPATGGRYVIAKPGAEPKRVEGTQIAADGARARDADGARLNRVAVPAMPAAPVPTAPAPAPTAPAGNPAKT